MSDSQAEKNAILLAALNERYKSIHIIRERVQNICVWTLGLLLTAGAWLIQSDIILSPQQKIFYVFGVLLAFVFLRYMYLEDLHKGFTTQLKIAAHIEKQLGLYSENFFGEGSGLIYPDGWQKVENNSSFFNSTYSLLYIGVLFLVITVLFHGGILFNAPCYNLLFKYR